MLLGREQVQRGGVRLLCESLGRRVGSGGASGRMGIVFLHSASCIRMLQSGLHHHYPFSLSILLGQRASISGVMLGIAWQFANSGPGYQVLMIVEGIDWLVCG